MPSYNQTMQVVRALLSDAGVADNIPALQELTTALYAGSDVLEAARDAHVRPLRSTTVRALSMLLERHTPRDGRGDAGWSGELLDALSEELIDTRDLTCLLYLTIQQADGAGQRVYAALCSLMLLVVGSGSGSVPSTARKAFHPVVFESVLNVLRSCLDATGSAVQRSKARQRERQTRTHKATAQSTGDDANGTGSDSDSNSDSDSDPDSKNSSAVRQKDSESTPPVRGDEVALLGLRLVSRVLEGSFLEGEDKSDTLLLTLETLGCFTAIPGIPASGTWCWKKVAEQAFGCIEFCLTAPAERFGSPANLLLRGCGRALLRTLACAGALSSSKQTAFNAASASSTNAALFFCRVLEKCPSLQPAVLVLLEHASLLGAQLRRTEPRTKAAESLCFVVSPAHEGSADAAVPSQQGASAGARRLRVVDDSFTEWEEQRKNAAAQDAANWDYAKRTLRARYMRFVLRLAENASPQTRSFAAVLAETLLTQRGVLPTKKNAHSDDEDVEMTAASAPAGTDATDATDATERELREALLWRLVMRCGDKASMVRSRSLLSVSSVLRYALAHAQRPESVHVVECLSHPADGHPAKTVADALKTLVLFNIGDAELSTLRRHALGCLIALSKLVPGTFTDAEQSSILLRCCDDASVIVRRLAYTTLTGYVAECGCGDDHQQRWSQWLEATLRLAGDDEEAMKDLAGCSLLTHVLQPATSRSVAPSRRVFALKLLAQAGTDERRASCLTLLCAALGAGSCKLQISRGVCGGLLHVLSGQPLSSAPGATAVKDADVDMDADTGVDTGVDTATDAFGMPAALENTYTVFNVGCWTCLSAFSCHRRNVRLIDQYALVETWEKLSSVPRAALDTERGTLVDQSLVLCLRCIGNVSEALTASRRASIAEECYERVKRFADSPSVLQAMVKVVCAFSAATATEQSKMFHGLSDECYRAIGAFVASPRPLPTQGDEDALSLRVFLAGEICMFFGVAPECVAESLDDDTAPSKRGGGRERKRRGGGGSNSNKSKEGGAVGGSSAAAFTEHAALIRALTAETLSGVVLPTCVRAHALLALGKMCVLDNGLTKRSLAVFTQVLDSSPFPVLRRDACVVLGNLLTCHTVVAELALPALLSRLVDPSPLVRRQAVFVVTNLLREGFVRWQGSPLALFMLLRATADTDRVVAEKARLSLDALLRGRESTTYYGIFVESLFHFNNFAKHKEYNRFAIPASALTCLAETEGGGECRRRRLGFYCFMLQRMDNDHKLQVMTKLTKEVIAAAAEGTLDLKSGENVISDAIVILASKELKVDLSADEKPSADEDDLDLDLDDGERDTAKARRAAQQAHGRLVSKLEKKTILEALIPVMIQLKHRAEAARSPLLRTIMPFFKVMAGEYKQEMADILTANPQLKRELEYDFRQLAQFSPARQQQRQQQQSTTLDATKETITSVSEIQTPQRADASSDSLSTSLLLSSTPKLRKLRRSIVVESPAPTNTTTSSVPAARHPCDSAAASGAVLNKSVADVLTRTPLRTTPRTPDHAHGRRLSVVSPSGTPIAPQRCTADDGENEPPTTVVLPTPRKAEHDARGVGVPRGERHRPSIVSRGQPLGTPSGASTAHENEKQYGGKRARGRGRSKR